MSQFLDNMSGSCDGHCHDCALLDAGARVDPSGGWAGGRLALAATGVFLLPLFLAIVGAFFCRGHYQAPGGLAGLLAGMLLARLITRLIPVTREDHDANRAG